MGKRVLLITGIIVLLALHGVILPVVLRHAGLSLAIMAIVMVVVIWAHSEAARAGFRRMRDRRSQRIGE